MKKIIFICLIVILGLLLVFLTIRGSSHLLIHKLFEDLGNRDWRVILPEGYEIHKLNADRIILVKDGWAGNVNIVVSDYINAYRYNDQYIQIWCARDGRTDLLGIDNEEDRYYLVDIQTDTLRGPYSKKEFESITSQQPTMVVEDWTYTSPRPQDAVFY